jgi:hypothetical protein
METADVVVIDGGVMGTSIASCAQSRQTVLPRGLLSAHQGSPPDYAREPTVEFFRISRVSA